MYKTPSCARRTPTFDLLWHQGLKTNHMFKALPAFHVQFRGKKMRLTHETVRSTFAPNASLPNFSVGLLLIWIVLTSCGSLFVLLVSCSCFWLQNAHLNVDLRPVFWPQRRLLFTFQSNLGLAPIQGWLHCFNEVVLFLGSDFRRDLPK